MSRRMMNGKLSVSLIPTRHCLSAMSFRAVPPLWPVTIPTRPSTTSAHLFYSYAKDTARQDSDVDIALLLAGTSSKLSDGFGPKLG